MDCAICQRTYPRRRWNSVVHGRGVCRRCQLHFAGRRLLAFGIDVAVYWFGLYALADALFAALTTGLAPSARITTLGDLAAPQRAIIMALRIAVFLTRDGWFGASLGKRLLGLYVIHRRHREPIGWLDSFKRSAVFVLPLAWPFLAVQALTGSHGGDELAQTRVIWRRYEFTTPFNARALNCTGCGYTLRGNQSGRCPECGRAA